MEIFVPDHVFTRIIKNTVFLYISTFIGQIAALILLPIIIGKVGKADYGLYVLALSVPPLLSFLDFGMSTAVVKMLAPLHSVKDKDKINEIFLSVLFLRVVTGVLMGACIWIISYHVARFFKIEAHDIMKAARLFRIIAVFIAVNWTLLIFRSVVFARERYEYDTVSSIVNSISGFFLAIALLNHYKTIEAATCGLLGGQILGNLINLFGSWKLLPHLTLSRHHANFKTLKAVYGFGGKIFITSVCSSALYQLDKSLLGIFQSMAQLGDYGIADSLHQIPRMVNLLSTNAIMPAVSNLESKDEWDKINRIIYNASKAVAALVYPIVFYLFFFAKPFITWYVGGEFKEAVTIVRVFIIYLIFYVHTGAIGNALVGTGRVNFLVAQNVIVLALKVLLSLFLIPRYGALGAVLSTTIILSLSSPIILIVGGRILRGSLSFYAKRAIFPHLLPMLFVILFCYFARPFVEPRFSSLLWASLIVFAIYQGLFYLLGLKKEERKILWVYIRNYKNRKSIS